MPNDSSEFLRRRFDRSDDNTEVTPEELLEVALDDVRSGRNPFKSLLILYETPNDDGTFQRGYYAANLDKPNHLSMLEIEKVRLLDDWLDK